MERIILAASIIMVAVMLLAGTSLAKAQYPSFNTLGHHHMTTVSGTVERIISPTEFTLRANHHVVMVRIASEQPPVLNEGDNITVTFIPGGNEKEGVNASVISMNQRANS